ncbi:hypothetical protein DEO72_LG8g2422 [Vigna unguiculata]|uniref:Uncharacterized protein n=1 Tax=Vigna unguiculata TaxID=3917 RepID=A0A4D6MSF4_VIGUN|nr:hypothetical protein DEO72_LG8g2422 [Vigna unguiculata]
MPKRAPRLRMTSIRQMARSFAGRNDNEAGSSNTHITDTQHVHFRAGKPGQNPDMHAPPDGTGTAVRRLVGIACYHVVASGMIGN